MERIVSYVDLHCTLLHCYIHNGDAQTKEERRTPVTFYRNI